VAIRFFDRDGNLKTSRRGVSSLSSVTVEDVKDAGRLADTIRKLQHRVSDLEARMPPSAVEFECILPDGDYIRLQHNLGCPVRWYLTDNRFGQGSLWVPSELPSDLNTLVLYHEGGECYGVIRIEPAQHAITPRFT
jgi:hypothetical protein